MMTHYLNKNGHACTYVKH